MSHLLDTAIEVVQRRSLKRNASRVETGIIPLSQIRHAVALIDVEDTSFDLCKNRILLFFREHNIHCEIFFLDFRKLGDGERLITSINGTILRKDLNWFGRPSDEKMRLLQELNPDLLVAAIPEKNFAFEYIVRVSNARFKIGRQQLSGNVFDIVVQEKDDTRLNEADAFQKISELLLKIR